MKRLDVLLQERRIDRTRRYLRPGARVLDIGCADGALFRRLDWVRGVGIDPDRPPVADPSNATLIRGRFPDDVPDDGPFDAITMLAVLEHVPPSAQPGLARSCATLLTPGGHLLLTVPSPLVDPIIDVLKAVRVLDGMADEEHYGFDVGRTRPVFEGAGLELVEHSRFQLGLNNFFAFRRPPA